MIKNQYIKTNLRRAYLFFSLLLALSLSACHRSGADTPVEQVIYVDFSKSINDWQAVFADYPTGQDALYELDFGHAYLPSPLQNQQGVYLSGSNHSDDLLMLIKTPLPNLKPQTAYRLRISLEIASNAAKNCAGIGGAPGESVYVKAGASPIEPKAITQNGYWRMNLDLGQQALPGAYALVLGDMATTQTDCLNTHYELKTFLQNDDQRFDTRSDENGVVWLYFLVDSGFEGKTTLYFTHAMLLLEEI